MTQLL